MLTHIAGWIALIVSLLVISPRRANPLDRGAVYSVKYGPAGAEFSVDPYFTHVFYAMFAGFGRLGAIFYSKKAKNGALRVNFGAVAAGTPRLITLPSPGRTRTKPWTWA
jgi:hypothetical protein